MKSPKEISLDKKLLKSLSDLLALVPEKDTLPLKIAQALMSDAEIQATQDYANSVSIIRLGFNDHGPVHMRTVSLNAITMLTILYQAKIPTSLVREKTGTFIDSLTAVLIASFMHDFGMTIGRQDHELYSTFLALPIIDRLLQTFLPGNENIERRTAVRSVAIEGIIGHMGTRKIHSIEAGLILIADGCDMTKGRARIPMALDQTPKVGDIHKYSANSIKKVEIVPGKSKPIRIQVYMSGEVGFFQIEEVLLQKINCSPSKEFVELLAGVDNEPMKQYL